MIFKTPYNQRDVKSKGEVFTLPSETVPEQTMSIREMLQRHVHGLPLSGNKVPIYEGTESPFQGRDPKTLDLSEIAEMRDQAIERGKTTLSKAKQAQKDAADKKYKADVEEAAKKLAKSSQQQSDGGDQPE